MNTPKKAVSTMNMTTDKITRPCAYPVKTNKGRCQMPHTTPVNRPGKGQPVSRSRGSNQPRQPSSSPKAQKKPGTMAMKATPRKRCKSKPEVEASGSTQESLKKMASNMVCEVRCGARVTFPGISASDTERKPRARGPR